MVMSKRYAHHRHLFTRWKEKHDSILNHPRSGMQSGAGASDSRVVHNRRAIWVALGSHNQTICGRRPKSLFHHSIESPSSVTLVETTARELLSVLFQVGYTHNNSHLLCDLSDVELFAAPHLSRDFLLIRRSDGTDDQLSAAAPPPQDLFHKTHPYAKALYPP